MVMDLKPAFFIVEKGGHIDIIYRTFNETDAE